MRLDLPALDNRYTSRDIAQRVEKQQRRNRRHYNGRHRTRPTPITVGDTVCVRQPGHVGKTATRFSQPLRVIRRLGRATFGLSDGSKWNVAHLAKKETGTAPPASSPPVLSPPPSPTCGDAAPVCQSPPVVSRDTAQTSPPPARTVSPATPDADETAEAVAPPSPLPRTTPAPSTSTSVPPPSDSRSARELSASSFGRRRFKPDRLDL